MKLRAAVISWEGKEERARTIAMHLRDHVDRVGLTYSTSGNDIVIPGVEGARVPSDWYFGRKFEHSIRNWGDEAMLLVHADTDTADWGQVVAACARALSTPPIKIWSPEIDVTPFPTEVVQLGQASSSNYLVVAQTDGIVLGLGPDVVQRLRQLDYRGNNLGWGVDWVAICHTYTTGGVAVRDRSVQILHEKGSGYQAVEAAEQMQDFLQQMTLAEQVQYQLLSMAIRNRRHVLARRRGSA